jgi:hypothetical protein
MSYHTPYLPAIETLKTTAETPQTLVQTSDIITKRQALPLAVGAAASEEAVHIGWGGVASVVDAEAV